MFTVGIPKNPFQAPSDCVQLLLTTELLGIRCLVNTERLSEWSRDCQPFGLISWLVSFTFTVVKKAEIHKRKPHKTA